jgi:type III secretion protein D
VNTPRDVPAYQLRILSGMHAGARAPLEGDEYTLGALDDCDFVLTDSGVQPRHARLSRLEGGWQLDWVAKDGEEPVLAPMRLEPGKAVTLGPIVVVLDEPAARWPTLEQLVLVPHAPALGPQLPPPSVDAARALEAESVLRSHLGRGTAAWLASVTAAGLSALALVAWPMDLDSHRVKVQQAPAPAAGHSSNAAAVEEERRRAIEAAIAPTGLADRTTVLPAGAGWTVRALALTDSEGEVLSAALSRLQPRPALRISTEQDLRDEVMDMLLRMAPDFRGNLSLRYVGEGRFRVEGSMNRASERDKLLRSLAAAFPQVRGWDNAVVAGEDAAVNLVAELRSHGWQIDSNWNEGVLEVGAGLPRRDLRQWEDALAAAARKHTVPFRATVQFVQGPAAPANPENKLPFQIRGVVGGDMPYVLMPDGEKLARGGVWQGWRLASVSAGQVLFENGARRAIVQR